jgi:hypothetical protein
MLPKQTATAEICALPTGAAERKLYWAHARGTTQAVWRSLEPLKAWLVTSETAFLQMEMDCSGTQ